MNRYLLVGDIHIRHDNFDEIDLLLDQICTNLRRYGPNISLILLGDILHTFEKVFTPCLNKACEFIRSCSQLAPTYVLVGNHDYINQYQFQTDQHWMNPLKQWGDRVFIIDKAQAIEDRILACPYVQTGRLTEALESADPNWKINYQLVLCHQEVRGCKMGVHLSELGDVWDSSYPQLISGHIHETQYIGSNVFYPGAPLQHSFSDYQHERIVSLVEWKQDRFIRQDIPLEVPRKQVVRMTLAEVRQRPPLLEKKGDKSKLIVNDLTVDQFKLFKQSKEYQDLVSSGIQVHVHPTSSKKSTTVVATQMGTFKDILYEMSKQENVQHIFKKFIV